LRIGRCASNELLPVYHRPSVGTASGSDKSRPTSCRATGPTRLRNPLTSRRTGDPCTAISSPGICAKDNRGQLWLIDWEDAGWGPPLADLVRFIVAYQSLVGSSPAGIAAQVRKILATESAEAVQEAARFWLHHRNLQPVQKTRELAASNGEDVARGARELPLFAFWPWGMKSPSKRGQRPYERGRLALGDGISTSSDFQATATRNAPELRSNPGDPAVALRADITPQRKPLKTILE
jgi:hypothetical protein